MKLVIVVLHGGLGNQLFQLFAGTAEAESTAAPLRIFTDVLDRYGVPRAMEIGPLLDDPAATGRLPPLAWAAARARLPKVRARLTGAERILAIGPWRIVDGYFQTAADAGAVSPTVAAAVLARWRHALGLGPASPQRAVEHVRLRDFFASAEAARTHAEMRVAAAGPADFMTDDAAILGPVLERQGRRRDLVETEGWSGLDSLRAMAGYATIRTNGSTLALWAALLGGGHLQTSVEGHADFITALGGSAAPLHCGDELPIGEPMIARTADGVRP